MMIEKILVLKEEHALWQKKDRILIACSGGPDSLCLADIFIRLAGREQLEIFIAHVEHGIRGEDSWADAEFVQTFSAKHGIPFYMTHIDSIGYARKNHLSVEEAARFLRYEFLQQTARKLQCQSIALAHHMGDQAETVILHLVRGAGSKGLSGIRPRINNLIRPLLNCTRAEIELYCQQRGLVPRRDCTNLDTNYRRNNIRHVLLPFLKKYNPDVVQALAQSADIISAEYDFMEDTARLVLKHLGRKEKEGISLDIEALMKEPLAIKRIVLRLAVAQIYGDIVDISFAHIENILRFIATGNTGRSLDLPHRLQIEIIYGRLLFKQKKTLVLPCECQLHLGENILTEFGCKIILEELISSEYIEGNASCLVDAELITYPLVVRHRENGDYFYPKGINGKKKIKKLFIDRKIPCFKRTIWPLVCQGDQIVWVAGIQQDGRFAVTENTKKYLKMTFLEMNKDGIEHEERH